MPVSSKTSPNRKKQFLNCIEVQEVSSESDKSVSLKGTDRKIELESFRAHCEMLRKVSKQLEIWICSDKEINEGEMRYFARDMASEYIGKLHAINSLPWEEGYTDKETEDEIKTIIRTFAYDLLYDDNLSDSQRKHIRTLMHL